jgi:hypothetical protein
MRQERKRPEPSKNRDDASLYPLDLETAIKAIMETGPHPRGKSGSAKQKQPKTNRRRESRRDGSRLVEGREPETDDPKPEV